MKVIIAGSRSIKDSRLLIQAINNALGIEGIQITEVVCGMAPGVDMMGHAWAKKNDIPIKEFPAKWRINGVLDKQAGFKRNFEMAKYAEAAIILHDGYSKGTLNMLECMNNFNKPVYLVTTNRSII